MYDILHKVRSDYNPEKMRHHLCGVLDDAIDCLRQNETTPPGDEKCDRIWFAATCWPSAPVNATVWNSCSPSSDENATDVNGLRMGKLALHCNSSLLDWNPRLFTHSCFGSSFENEFGQDSGNSTIYEYGTQDTSGSTYSVAEVLEFLDRTEDPGIELELSDAKYSTFMKVMTAVHALSIFSLLMALVLLSLLRRLHCTRIFIHMNLMTSFMLRGLIWIIHHFAFRQNDEAHEEVEMATVEMVSLIMGRHYTDDLETVDSLRGYYCSNLKGEETYVWCRIYFVALNYLVTANYFWLLVEGLYLRLLLRAVSFSQKKFMRGFLILGWGVPWVTVLAAVILKRLNQAEKCWFDTSKDAHWWIINTPIQISLMINFVIFMMVVGQVVSKLKDNQRHQVMERNDDYKWRLTKSTLALVPLLGVQYVISAILELTNIGNPNVLFVLKAYDLSFTAIQGFLIAFLYCFCTKEVQEECGKMWRRVKVTWELSRMEHNHLKAQRRRKSLLLSNSSAAVTTSYFVTSRKTDAPTTCSDNSVPRYVTTQSRHQQQRLSVQSNIMTSHSNLAPKPSQWKQNRYNTTSFKTSRDANDKEVYDVTVMKRYSSPVLTGSEGLCDGGLAFETCPRLASKSCQYLPLEVPREVKIIPNVETPLVSQSEIPLQEMLESLDSVDV